MSKQLTIEENQKAGFEVLLKLKEIFDTNGWKYYLTYGTLIGAIRHKGFIPWDDDIDLWVPRPDYEKFIKYCIDNKESLLPYELIHYKTNKKYIYTLGRFSDTRYKIDYDNTVDYGLGVFVDIYPLDGFVSNDFIQRKTILNYKRDIAMYGCIEMVPSKNPLKNIIKKIRFKQVKKMDITELLRKNDELAQKHDYNTTPKKDCIAWCYDLHGYTDEDFDGKDGKGTYLEFNGVSFRVPSAYDKILTTLYQDYMELPPEEDRVGHHFYKTYLKDDKKEGNIND